MSDWEKNHETASQLLDIVQTLKRQTDPKNMKQIQRFVTISKDVKLSEDYQYDEIMLLKRRITELERRVDTLQSMSDAQPSDRTKSLIKKIFSKVPIIKKIYTKPEQSGILLIIVHNSETISSAIDHIQPGLDKLEVELPDLYFDPWILRPNEIYEEHLQQSKLIFERDDN